MNAYTNLIFKSKLSHWKISKTIIIWIKIKNYCILKNPKVLLYNWLQFFMKGYEIQFFYVICWFWIILCKKIRFKYMSTSEIWICKFVPFKHSIQWRHTCRAVTDFLHFLLYLFRFWSINPFSAWDWWRQTWKD